MNEDPTQVTVVLLAGGAVLSLIGWLTPLPRLAMALASGLLLTGGVLAALADPGQSTDRAEQVALVVAGALLAVAGGGPVTTVLFDLVDRPGTLRQDSLQGAGEVLRGGAWIGALERLAAYAAVVTGWPEGLAVVLAIKGLGRYPELRAAEDGVRTGAAERFIIGTFASVLWACASAGVIALVH